MPLSNAAPSAYPGQIPFLVGVTGHRDLVPEELPALAAAVGATVEELRQRLPATPLLLLSALAEGADQLAASVALAHGAQLAAVLPMPAATYRATLDEAARDPFDTLLARAAFTIELPPGTATEAELAASPEARVERYEALAAFLATRSQALLALWDGQPSEKPGGTARVVHYMLNGAPGAPEEEPRAGLVYHIATSRLSGRRLPPGAAARTVLRTPPNDAPDPVTTNDLFQMARRLDAFNRDVAAHVAPCDRPWNDLLNGQQPASELPQRCRSLAASFRAADLASLRFNRRTKQVLVVLLSCALLALTSFEIHAHVLPHLLALWLVYPLALAAGWVIYQLARRRQLESRYLDYRALAEALRVQFFWDLAGVPRSAADDYLRHHRTELDWIRSALRAVSLNPPPAPADPAQAADSLRLALTHWVRHQTAWYARKSRQQGRTLDRLDERSGILLFAVWLVSILVPLSLLLPLPCLAHWRAIAAHEPYHGLLLLLVPLPSLAIGLFRVWVEQGGFGEQARKYHRMAHVFGRAATRLERDLDDGQLDHARQTLRRLGVEALEENGDWLLLHRDRPLKVVGSA
jgi:hypothetical protein